MYELRTTREIGLGNGTRQPGELLARVECPDCQQLLAAAIDQVGGGLDELPADVEPADGVLPREVLTCLRNPHLCEFVSLGAEFVSLGAEIVSSSEEFVPPADEPAESPPPAPKRRSRRKH